MICWSLLWAIVLGEGRPLLVLVAAARWATATGRDAMVLLLWIVVVAWQVMGASFLVTAGMCLKSGDLIWETGRRKLCRLNCLEKRAKEGQARPPSKKRIEARSIALKIQKIALIIKQNNHDIRGYHVNRVRNGQILLVQDWRVEFGKWRAGLVLRNKCFE